MIRGMTVLWTALALIVGVGLFLLKYEVATLEDRLAGLNREIYENQQAIHVLKAEWSYLNEPERLRELNERHLGLAAVAPARIAQIDAVPINDGTTPPAADEGRAMAAAPAKPDVAKAAAPAKRPARPAPQETRPAVATQPPAPARPQTTPVAAPAAKPRPALPALPVAAPAIVSPTLAPEGRPNVTVITSPALLEAEVSSRRITQ